jgi:hypothetical protein
MIENFCNVIVLSIEINLKLIKALLINRNGVPGFCGFRNDKPYTYNSFISY